MMKLKKHYLLTLFVLFMASTAFAQHQVTGRVVSDVTGETLPFATVRIQGTNVGTITNIDGAFTISVPSADAVLVFSLMGYQDLELPVDIARPMAVRMPGDAITLEGVVITGMFTRRANTYTGSIVMIERDELLRGGNQNVLTSLSTLDPSLMMMTNLMTGSDPNALPDLQMRGASSLPDLRGEFGQNPNQPLFILDGFETPIQIVMDLDMQMIENITILRDATAKAIYGARAANGVVIIETRRPERGRMRVSYTGNINLEIPDITSYNLTSAREKLDVERLAGLFSTDHVDMQIRLQQNYDYLLRQVLGGVNTHWISQPLRVGIGNRHSFLIEGGDDYMLYGINLSYNRISGVMKGSDRTTFSGGVNLTYRVNRFQFRNRLTITDNTANHSPYGSFVDFASMNPYYRIRNDRGEIIQYHRIPSEDGVTPGGGPRIGNPMWNATLNTINSSGYTDITNNFFAEYAPFDNLRFTGRFGFSQMFTSADLFRPARHTDFIDFADEDLHRRGFYRQTRGEMRNIGADLGVSHSILRGNHMLFSNLMLTMSDLSSHSNFFEAEGFPNDHMSDISFATQYAYGRSPGGHEHVSRTAGAILSVNYSFADRYLFDANFRRSGSSDFGADRRWGSFWSLGVGWNLHEESFIRDLGIFNQFRFRASTGYTGSQGFSTFDAISTFRYFGTEQYFGHIGSFLMRLANPNLSWQRTHDNNLGLDFMLLNRRLTARFDYYISTTRGLVTQVTAPPSMGFPTFSENLGTVENRGLEALITYRVWQDPRRRNYVQVMASLAHNRNTLLRIDESLRAWNDEQDNLKNLLGPEATDSARRAALRYQNTPSVRFVEGQSMDAIWAVRSMGIDPTTGQEVFVTRNGERTFDWNAADQVVVGDAMPRFRGIVGVNVELFNFTLNIIGEYRLGGQIYNQTLKDRVENANLWNNVDRRVFTDRWTQPGDIARFKAITDHTPTRPSSRFVEDFNQFALRTLNVSYDFRDMNFVRNSFLQRLRFTVFFDDLFVLQNVHIERGINFPFARRVSFSIQASF